MTLHILIVDPDAGAAQVTCATIKHLAPETDCTIAADPVQGWLQLSRRSADVLIIDPARYPQVGQQLLKVVGEAMPGTQVIVLSSSVVPPARHLPGVHAYLEKGLSPGMLRIKLKTLIQRAASRKSAASHAPAGGDSPALSPIGSSDSIPIPLEHAA